MQYDLYLLNNTIKGHEADQFRALSQYSSKRSLAFQRKSLRKDSLFLLVCISVCCLFVQIRSNDYLKQSLVHCRS